MSRYTLYAKQALAVAIITLIASLSFFLVTFGQSPPNNVFLPLVLNAGSSSNPSPTSTATSSNTPTATPTTLPLETATFIPTEPATSTPTNTQTPTSTPTATSLATSTSTPTDTPLPTSAVVIQANNSWFTDSIGKLHIVGEVLNTGLGNVQSEKMTANIFNSSNQLVGVGSAFTNAFVIPPGVRACFHIYMDQPNSWSYYQLEGTNFTGGTNAPGLIAFNVSTSTGIAGEPKILGQVRNDGATRANSVIVAGTLYNSSQTVIGCDFAYVSSTNLDAGQTSSFAILFFARTYPPIDSYRLQVDGFPQ